VACQELRQIKDAEWGQRWEALIGQAAQIGGIFEHCINTEASLGVAKGLILAEKENLFTAW
jgi:hypothetical protein